MDEKDINYDDIQLNGSIATWELNTEGKILGTYSGTFKFRCFLTPLQLIAVGREQRALLGESKAWVETVDYEHESFLAYALIQLKYRIIESPPFWKSSGVNKTHDGDIPDQEVLEKILDAAIRSELKYKDDLKKRKEKAIQAANEGVKYHKENQKKEDEEITKALPE